jgi:hypothetical protein
MGDSGPNAWPYSTKLVEDVFCEIARAGVPRDLGLYVLLTEASSAVNRP